MVRMSKPRTLYSPPRNSFSKIGSSFEPVNEWMYSACAAHAERQPVGLLEEPHALDHRLVEVGVAAEAGEVDRRGEALAAGREDRLVDRVVDVATARPC